MPLRCTRTAGSCATYFFRNSISTCVACCPPKITRPSPQNRPNTRSSVVRRNSWPQGWRQCAASVKLPIRSEEHTSELQSLMRISYAVFCLKKKNHKKKYNHRTHIIHQHKKQ